MLEKENYLPTNVNNVGVWVIEGQKHSVAGVHLINSYGLVHVLLEKTKVIYQSFDGMSEEKGL